MAHDAVNMDLSINAVDPELQLTAEELQLLLDTTTPTTTTTGAAQNSSSSSSPLHHHHTSGDDDASSSGGISIESQLPLLLPPTTQRARRTEIEKHSRRKRQATLREMRDQVRLLESQMAAMLAHAATPATTGTATTGTAVTVTATSDAFQQLRAQFVQLSLDAQRLEAEKHHLRKMLRARQLFSQSVASLSAAFVDDWDDRTWPYHQPQDQNHSHRQYKYKPLPREEHFRVMRESFEAITKYDAREDLVSSGNTFFGWKDRRFVDEKGMFFSFTKQFPGHDPEQVMLDSWAIFSQEEQLTKALMRGNSGSLRLHKLQEPNDDVVILHRQTKFIKFDKTFHTVYLLFRLRTQDGYTICFRTIPAPGIQESLEELDMWIDNFHWIHFKHLIHHETGQSDGCEVVFGGAIGGALFTTIAEFLLGSFATVVRWENACIAPMFIMASE